MAIDPVTLEILKNHCRAAAESMAFTLYRTAHSTFVKETEDFTTGLTTPEGLTFATPVELGATWFVGLNYANVIKAIDHYDEVLEDKEIDPSLRATVQRQHDKIVRHCEWLKAHAV